MKTKIPVSVCIPTYNGERYLDDCLASIQAQSWNNYELIIVDDCSTDSTLDIIRKYAQGDPRIKVFSNEHNLGLVANWNRCIELAGGEWIKFVFQDDLLLVDCLERMLAAATRPIVFCRREFLFETSTDEDTIRIYNEIPIIADIFGNVTDIDPVAIREALLLDETSNFFGEPTAALLHCSLFDRFGLFNNDLAQICDLEYWIRVSINTGISYVADPLATFRYHSSSTSSSNRDPLKGERVIIFDHLLLLHELAYNPHYSSIRRQASRSRPKRNFQRELAKKAVWIHAHACSIENTSPTIDHSWLKRWDELVEKYPRMSSSTWHLPYQVRETWKRYISWRFER